MSRRDIRLTEHLITASLERLDQEILKCPELDKFIHTKFKDLPEKYLNLFDPSYIKDVYEKDLYSIIKDSLGQSFIDLVYFYSETDSNWLEGFASYTVNHMGTDVTNISVFSFDSEHPSYVLARDIIILLDELQSKYERINFTCTSEQPMLKWYIKETEKRNGYWEQGDEDDDYHFEIPGIKFQERLNRWGFDYKHGKIRRV